MCKHWLTPQNAHFAQTISYEVLGKAQWFDVNIGEGYNILFLFCKLHVFFCFDKLLKCLKCMSNTVMQLYCTDGLVTSEPVASLVCGMHPMIAPWVMWSPGMQT